MSGIENLKLLYVLQVGLLAAMDIRYCILLSIVRTFFLESDAEMLTVHYTWKVAFTNLIHKQSIQVKL
jgi:hypothetical protein